MLLDRRIGARRRNPVINRTPEARRLRLLKSPAIALRATQIDCARPLCPLVPPNGGILNDKRDAPTAEKRSRPAMRFRSSGLPVAGKKVPASGLSGTLVFGPVSTSRGKSSHTLVYLHHLFSHGKYAGSHKVSARCHPLQRRELLYTWSTMMRRCVARWRVYSIRSDLLPKPTPQLAISWLQVQRTSRVASSSTSACLT